MNMKKKMNSMESEANPLSSDQQHKKNNTKNIWKNKEETKQQQYMNTRAR